MKKKTYNFIISFLISFSLFSYSLFLIIIPFRSQNKNSENIAEELFPNFSWTDIIPKKIYTEVGIGEPHQSIIFNIFPENYPFLIGTGLCYENSTSSYNYNFSSSYKKSIQYPLQYKGITNGYYSYETFTFYNSLDLKNNFTLNNFLFYLGIKNEKDKICGEIGLSPIPLVDSTYYEDENELPTFLGSLKFDKYISNYLWTYEFFKKGYDNNRKKIINFKNIENQNIINNYEGFIIIGEYPHEYNSDEYDNKNIRTTSTIKDKNTFSNKLIWGLEFTKIFYNKTNNVLSNVVNLDNNSLRAELVINLNYIISTNDYFEKIKKDYFNYYLNQKICEINKKEINFGDYEIISCNKNSFNSSEVKKFPDIFFVNNYLNFIFNLTSEELFLENDNSFIFLIINRKGLYSNNWIFGKLFLKKYHFVFDLDSKTVSFYTERKNLINKENITKDIQNEENKKDSENKKEKNKYHIIWIIVSGVLFACGIYVGYKIFYKERKKRAVELDDQYEYCSKNLNDNKAIN